MRRRWLAALAGVLAGAVACGPDNRLSGSVDSLFALHALSEVQVHRNAEALQVSYFANRGADVDLVVRLTVRTDGLALRPGEPVALEGEAAPGHSRAVVLHAAAGEPVRWLPPVQSGTLVLEDEATVGEESRGSFDLRFAPEPAAYGAGRTLSGHFRAEVLDGGF